MTIKEAINKFDMTLDEVKDFINNLNNEEVSELKEELEGLRIEVMLLDTYDYPMGRHYRTMNSCCGWRIREGKC